MKHQITATFLIVLLAIFIAGCGKGTPPSGNESKAAKAQSPGAGTPAKTEAAPATSTAPAKTATPSNTNTAAAKPAETAPVTDGPVDVTKLVGVYEMVQVQKEGVVNMISQLKTRFPFHPEG